MADLTLVANGDTKPLPLDGGRFLAPGETARVDLSSEAHAGYVEEGRLVKQTDRKKSRRKTTTTQKKEK